MKARYSVALTTVAMGILAATQVTRAQVLTDHFNYSVRDTNDCYSPLFGSNIINAGLFLNSDGAADPDDGTLDSIPVGFTFDYNGMLSNSVNINVDGWVSVNPLGRVDPIPSANPQLGSKLFSAQVPNNTLAPFWGDHFYRTIETGYKPSQISYATESYFPSTPDPNAIPFTPIHVFTVEWRNLNVNLRSDPNSVASFQLIIRQNPKAFDQFAPDQRATIEFRYGPADSLATVSGASVGIEDSDGSAFLNGLFESSQFNGDSSRFSTALTTCWPPPNCTASPCTAIEFVPTGELASVGNPANFATAALNCYPNPFTEFATLSFTSAATAPTQISILNVLGDEVARVYDGDLSDGEHSFTWDARGAAPGMYECLVRSAGRQEETPILIAR